MQIRIIYQNDRGKSVDAIVGEGDSIIVLIGVVKKHPHPATIVEVVSQSKVKVSMRDGTIKVFNKNRIRLLRNKE